MQIKSSFFTNKKTLFCLCLATAVAGMVTMYNKKTDNVNVQNKTENIDNKNKQTEKDRNEPQSEINYAGYIDYWNMRKK